MHVHIYTFPEIRLDWTKKTFTKAILFGVDK